MAYILYRKKLDFYHPDQSTGSLGAVIVTENPDFETLYPHVDHWLLEIDDETERVSREIGIDKENVPITIGPWGCNYGVFADSKIDMREKDHETITAALFEEMWDTAKDRLER